MIEIKLTDLPEFDRQLRITILLEKDGEGIRESITTTPEPSSSPSPVDSTPPTTKRASKKKTTQESGIKETGDGINNAESGVEKSLPTPAIETSTASHTTPTGKRRSGNMMSMEF